MVLLATIRGFGKPSFERFGDVGTLVFGYFYLPSCLLSESNFLFKLVAELRFLADMILLCFDPFFELVSRMIRARLELADDNLVEK